MKHVENKIFLHPGDFCFLNESAHIHTILGSCIAITLWHPVLCIGGMCHFTHPKHPIRSGSTLDGRYADDVMSMFKQEVTQYGTKLKEFDAKIFGGGNMMKSRGEDIDDSIGTKNSIIAMQLLMQEDVTIQVAHVGEFGHRRIIFDIDTGDVWVRYTESNGIRRKSINGKI